MRILAVITAADTTHACLDAALVAAAADRSAAIDALHVVVDPEQLVVSTEEVQLQRMREAGEGSARDRERAARAAFITWNAGLDPGDPHVAWKPLTGTEEGVIAQEARNADLIVLARAHDIDSSDAQHAALLATGKPVLIVPGGWRANRRRFDHIAVGLGDDPVADGAIRAAFPWLKKAEHVTAIRIGEEGDLAAKLAGRLLDMGIKAEVRMVAGEDENLGAQIVRAANALRADLLVAGAYRHGSLVEWLLGGTTRHLLAAAELPLMLCH
ncbi:universal stress protein [Sphingomonas sp. H39-1-10]|uniref:universal stress protein n=1 Tax=Sphingomonas pollutisoli TaxID=3030829 RepID=UPI0023BA06A9|nr:universal stress protein [Sphingomonas pollutisoli]MDF0490538.1 universal stress protein [Sphingomonas pollutisoli]